MLFRKTIFAYNFYNLKKYALIIVIVAGIICGSGIAIYKIKYWSANDATIINGSWIGQNLTEVGTNRLLTARIAVSALFALHPKEVVYLIAQNDKDGNELTAENDYLIKGIPLDARYWSITLYDENYFLVANEDNRYSYNLYNVKYESDSSFIMHVSSKRKNKNWLPAKNKGKFYLAIRMYHPETWVYKHLNEITLPTIEKVYSNE